MLAQQYSCSDTIKIRAQELSDIQLDSACQAMGDEELRFHTMLETGRVPVSDDYNDFLQVNIFNSSADYKKYAKAIFKINTDNGGMYLEGHPVIVTTLLTLLPMKRVTLRPSIIFGI